MSLHLHSLLWSMSLFSPVHARQQTKCLVSSSPYSIQSSLPHQGYVLKYKFIHHHGYTAMSFTRCQQHSIVTSYWPQLVWSKLLDPQPHSELLIFTLKKDVPRLLEVKSWLVLQGHPQISASSVKICLT